MCAGVHVWMMYSTIAAKSSAGDQFVAINNELLCMTGHLLTDYTITQKQHIHDKRLTMRIDATTQAHTDDTWNIIHDCKETHCAHIATYSIDAQVHTHTHSMNVATHAC